MDLKNGQNTGEVEHLKQSGKMHKKKKDDAKFTLFRAEWLVYVSPA
jgi:hypothetical protein